MWDWERDRTPPRRLLWNTGPEFWALLCQCRRQASSSLQIIERVVWPTTNTAGNPVEIQLEIQRKYNWKSSRNTTGYMAKIQLKLHWWFISIENLVNQTNQLCGNLARWRFSTNLRGAHLFICWFSLSNILIENTSSYNSGYSNF